MAGSSFRRVEGRGVLRLADGSEWPVRYSLIACQRALPVGLSTEQVSGYLVADGDVAFRFYGDRGASLRFEDGRARPVALVHLGNLVGQEQRLPITVGGISG